MFGPELIEAFRTFKAIWDPQGKMNPGKLIDADPVASHLRLGSSYDPAQPQTHFRFPNDEGSLARATLRCVGVGKCRRQSAEGQAPDDVMCPSFMVTRDEKHSTRGRAHLLWEMLRGGDSPIRDGFRSPHVKEALDLCLACKGCKGDCPLNVDVATYKAEFLSHYWASRLRPRYAYAFGLIDKWSRLAALAPRLVNLLGHTPGIAWLAKWLVGMASQRDIPRFARQTFVAWFRSRAKAAPAGRKRVVLWPDTFNNHFHPETAQAAVQVLEAAGYEVLVPERAVCCGRPLYDYGFLDLARRYLERTLAQLRPWLDEGLPIVVLEPSCASVFRDELINLMPARLEARRLATQTKLLSELLADAELPRLQRKAVVHGHCHHKAVLGFDAERQVLERIGLSAELLSSGCCGMAGSFGFEREPEKQRVAQACAERALFPAVRACDDETLLIADGFSCRTQIAQGTRRRALHLADVLKLALDGGSLRQERATPDVRGSTRRTAARALLLLLLALAAAGGGGWWLLRSRANAAVAPTHRPAALVVMNLPR
jgi:Fe-S oxidoreductase